MRKTDIVLVAILCAIIVGTIVMLALSPDREEDVDNSDNTETTVTTETTVQPISEDVESILEERYSGLYPLEDPTCPCMMIQVYDAEYKMYVGLITDYQKNDRLFYLTSMSNDPNPEDYCQGYILDGMIVVKHHNPYEELEQQIGYKYTGTFTADASCPIICGYDYDASVFAFFGRIGGPDTHEYEFSYFQPSKNEYVCVGKIDVDNKSIKVHTHSEIAHELD